MKSKNRIQFGIMVALITNVAFANVAINKSDYSASSTTQLTVASDTVVTVLKKPVVDSESDNTILNVATGYKKTIEEVIKEDNLIIESNLSNEVFPLDLKKLKKMTTKVKEGKPQCCFTHQCCIKS